MAGRASESAAHSYGHEIADVTDSIASSGSDFPARLNAVQVGECMSNELGLATTNISAGARIRSCWTRRRPLALRIFIPGLVGFEYSTGGPVPHLPRINLAERFQQMIAVYNAGSQNVQLFFEELLAFAKDLGEEEKRAISEGLSEQELAVFDLLTKPEPKLNKKEEQEVKTVAKDRLETLKREALVLDWRKKQQARASVWMTVEKA